MRCRQAIGGHLGLPGTKGGQRHFLTWYTECWEHPAYYLVVRNVAYLEGKRSKMPNTQKLSYDSPVQDAVKKLAMDPKLSNGQIAERVRKAVDGSRATAKSVASQVRLLRLSGVPIPPRRRQPQTPAA